MIRAPLAPVHPSWEAWQEADSTPSLLPSRHLSQPATSSNTAAKTFGWQEGRGRARKFLLSRSGSSA